MKKLFTLTITLMVSFSLMAQGDVVLFEADFSDATWNGTTFEQGNTEQPDIRNGITFYAKSNNNQFSYADGALTWPGNNMSNTNYFLAFPVTNINTSITINVYNGAEKTRVNYIVMDGATTFTTSGLNSVQNTASAAPTTVTIENLSTEAYVYLGRQGSGLTQITKIVVTTPAGNTTTPDLEESDEACAMHFYFFNDADQTANGVTNSDIFYDMPAGNSSSPKGAMEIDGKQYNVTRRSGDVGTATFVIPEGKEGTFYALAVSSGDSERTIVLTNTTITETYQATIAGGSSSYKEVILSYLPAGNYTLTTSGGNTRLGMVALKICEPSAEPSIRIDVETLDLKIGRSAVESKTATFTLVGKNLTATTGTITLPNTTDFTIDPATINIADGEINQLYTVTYTPSTLQDLTTGNIIIEIDGVEKIEIAVEYNKLEALTEAAVINETTIWDFSQTGLTTLQLSDITIPTKNEEFIFANMDIESNESFNAEALRGVMEYVVRDGKYCQGPDLWFTTSVAGTVEVSYSNTGSSNGTRYVYVNESTITGDEGSANTTAHTVSVDVPAGEVHIAAGVKEDGSREMLRFSWIKFEATGNTPSALETLGTDSKAVKVVENGQVYIIKNGVKYNILGIQVVE